jgi:type II secretory pathway component GspD/PulD (secretin)
MQLNRIAACTHRFTPVVVMAAVALATALMPPIAGAQTKSEETQPSEAKLAAPTAADTVQTIFLTHASEQNDFRDIQTDLRNVLPKAKIYGLETQNAITLRATPEDMETAKKLIADLDQARKLYRLTYTITEIDGGKRGVSQQFTLLVTSGESRRSSKAAACPS